MCHLFAFLYLNHFSIICCYNHQSAVWRRGNTHICVTDQRIPWCLWNAAKRTMRNHNRVCNILLFKSLIDSSKITFIIFFLDWRAGLTVMFKILHWNLRVKEVKVKEKVYLKSYQVGTRLAYSEGCQVRGRYPGWTQEQAARLKPSQSGRTCWVG